MIEVKADNNVLTSSNGFWIGSITAPATVGNYILNITAKDAVGNNYHLDVPYNVLNRQGGVSVSIVPRSNNVAAGGTVVPTIKIKNTQNIDDRFRTYISTDGIPVANQPNLNWFSWTEKFLDIRTKQEIILPVTITIPSGISGTYIFRARANSTTFTQVYAYDTGYIKIK